MLPLSQSQPIGDCAADGDRLTPVVRQPLRHFLLDSSGPENAVRLYLGWKQRVGVRRLPTRAQPPVYRVRIHKDILAALVRPETEPRQG